MPTVLITDDVAKIGHALVRVRNIERETEETLNGSLVRRIFLAYDNPGYYHSSICRDVLTCALPLPFAARLRTSLPGVGLCLAFLDAATGEVLCERRGSQLLQVDGGMRTQVGATSILLRNIAHGRSSVGRLRGITPRCNAAQVSTVASHIGADSVILIRSHLAPVNQTGPIGDPSSGPGGFQPGDPITEESG